MGVCAPTREKGALVLADEERLKSRGRSTKKVTAGLSCPAG